MPEKKVFTVDASEMIYYRFYIRARDEEEAKTAVECFNGDFFDYLHDGDGVEINTVEECTKSMQELFSNMILDADEYLD